MVKRLMGIFVLGTLVGGALAMAGQRPYEEQEQKTEAVIDARLHQLLVKMREARALR